MSEPNWDFKVKVRYELRSSQYIVTTLIVNAESYDKAGKMIETALNIIDARYINVQEIGRI